MWFILISRYPVNDDGELRPRNGIPSNAEYMNMSWEQDSHIINVLPRPTMQCSLIDRRVTTFPFLIGHTLITWTSRSLLQQHARDRRMWAVTWKKVFRRPSGKDRNDFWYSDKAFALTVLKLKTFVTETRSVASRRTLCNTKQLYIN